jgi:hypothetical protein
VSGHDSALPGVETGPGANSGRRLNRLNVVRIDVKMKYNESFINVRTYSKLGKK